MADSKQKTEKAPSKTAQIKELKETLKALTSEKENTKDKVKARQLRRGIRRATKKLNQLNGVEDVE